MRILQSQSHTALVHDTGLTNEHPSKRHASRALQLASRLDSRRHARVAQRVHHQGVILRRLLNDLVHVGPLGVAVQVKFEESNFQIFVTRISDFRFQIPGLKPGALKLRVH
jgi:hypothetical protein